jgi:hypothetical protein
MVSILRQNWSGSGKPRMAWVSLSHDHVQSPITCGSHYVQVVVRTSRLAIFFTVIRVLIAFDKDMIPPSLLHLRRR